MFLENFDTYAIDGETISIKLGDTTFTATVIEDHFADINDDDMHNIDQSVTGCTDEQQAKLLEAREAWHNRDWWYGGVVLSGERDGWVNDNLGSLYGIEVNYPNGDNGYLKLVANELLAEYLESIDTGPRFNVCNDTAMNAAVMGGS